MKRLALLTLLVSSPALARDDAPRPLAVVPVHGKGDDALPLAREIASTLSGKGLLPELVATAGPSVPSAPPVEAAQTCVTEGHAQAFRLEFGGALKVLADCEARLGPSLARVEGTSALSALLVEEAAAAVGSGDKNQARAIFQRLARLPGAVPPDPAVHPPEVVSLWDEIHRTPEPTRAVLLDGMPPWATIWIDAKPTTFGERLPLGTGSHYATADAAGYGSWSGFLNVDVDTTHLTIRLPTLDPDARHAAIRAAAGWTLTIGTPGAVDALTEAFGEPVLLVQGAAMAAPAQAVLLLPGDGGPAQVGGRWRAPSRDGAASAIAEGAAYALESPRRPGGRNRDHKTLYIVGAAAAGVLAAGAAIAFGQPKSSPGSKSGTVDWGP